METALSWFEALPEEGVIGLLQAAVGWEACLLEGYDVHVEP